MNPLDKLVLSAEATVYEAEGHDQKPVTASQHRSCGYSPTELRRKYGKEWEGRKVNVDGKNVPILNAVMPGGKRIPLLKAMLSTVCERNCRYCPFQAGRDFHRITFTPDKLAQAFFRLYQMRAVEGIFLSAGVFGSGLITQTRLLDTATILRHRLGYRGYLHLKIMPGADYDQVMQTMRLADRVSINLEAPNQKRLSHIAPTKQFRDELLRPLRWVNTIRRHQTPVQGWNQRWPSSSTQFVVGAAGESDLEILSVVAKLFSDLRLTRTYFEAFNPVPGTPLESQAPTDPVRQHRLYQASFLMRDYGFDIEDLAYTIDGNLALDRDPKLAYAQMTLKHTPVEINKADRSVLLRVPGLGPKSVTTILDTRHKQTFRKLGDLRKIGAIAERAAPFITLDGHRPPSQPKLL